jgi:hypothetical protein
MRRCLKPSPRKTSGSKLSAPLFDALQNLASTQIKLNAIHSKRRANALLRLDDKYLTVKPFDADLVILGCLFQKG